MIRWLAPLLFGVLGAAVLGGLGTWQLQRLAWKEGVLAEIASTITAEPVRLTADLDPETQRYLPVMAEGVIGDEELHVLVSQKTKGAGFRIITSFETGDGQRVLLDRGFIRVAEKDAPRQIENPVSLVGNLHVPDDRNNSTPENDPDGNYWFARDIAQMAAILGTEPKLVVARSETGPGVEPLPVSTEGIPNDHLEYVVTWFGLMAIWIGMTGYFLYRQSRTTN